MNFLSHYYFHRYRHDPELVMGCVLPDFLKNTDKTIRLQPELYELQFLNNPRLESLFEGWNHHIETDRIFHNLPFFYTHTQNLRILLAPVVEESPIRASFLSHISLELLLDHLLLVEGLADEKHFYAELEAVDRQMVDKFLKICGMENTTPFFDFLDRFIQHHYLSSYRDMKQVAFALIQISRRVWQLQSDDALQAGIAKALTTYLATLQPVFREVFDEIES